MAGGGGSGTIYLRGSTYQCCGSISQNKDVVTIRKGQPVAVHSSGVGVVLAGAALNGMYAVGLAKEDIAVGASGPIADFGDFQMSDWTPVVGSPSLAAKATYFLSDVVGQLSTVSPSSPGDVSQIVLREIAPDTASLRIESPILI
jgi:hypothetical protein